VPWCAECARFLSPSTVRPDGACPACGRTVEAGRARPPGAPVPGGDRNTDPGGDGTIRAAGATRSFPSVGEEDASPDRPAAGEGDGPGAERTDTDHDDTDHDDDLPPVPWHLKALAGGLVVYLGYRFMQGLEWVWRRFG